MKVFVAFILGIFFAIWCYKKLKASPVYQKWYQVQYRLKQNGNQHKPY